MPDPVLYQAAGHIATLTLNRPEHRNPISDPAMVEGLLNALARAEADPQIRVIVLTGAGAAFSSGGNLKTMLSKDGLKGASPMATRRNYRTGIQRLPLAFEALELPVIAAVNGPAIGAGCDLACMCDLRICAESAIFAESFVKLGLVPGDGGAWLLPRIVGFAKAAEMALTGDPIRAAEALRCGLVSAVVPDPELPAAATRLAARIAANPPAAVRMTRRLLREAYSATLTAVLDMSASMQALAQNTNDHEKAVMAALAKRQAEFDGT
jgi:enoyl-CoA hydratase/carnithine racemase